MLVREVVFILHSKVLLSIDVSPRWPLTLLWHAPERLKSKRGSSIACPEHTSATIPLHHVLHHASKEVVHRVRTSPCVSWLVECRSEKIVQTLSLEHLSKEVIWIEIGLAETSALSSFTSKRVVMLTLLRVAQTLVSLAHLFECILRSWRVVLVGVHF